MTIRTSLCMVGIAAMTTLTAQANSVSPTTADYDFVVEDKYKGKATRQLTQSGDTWRYRMTAKVAGVASAKQTSTFTLQNNQVIPSSASTTYKLFGIGRTHDLKFTQGGRAVTSTYKGKRKRLTSKAPAFDDLSLEMQIRQDLLNNKFTGNYVMAKKSKVENTRFRNKGNVKISVPAGVYNTVRIDRIHDDNDRSTSFWLAPSLDYLPVKVIQNNDGKKMQMTLSRVR